MADELNKKTKSSDVAATAPAKSPNALREEKVLEFWNARGIFQKSLDQVTAPHAGKKGNFIFYDGPPFATGLPHFGHVLPTSIKDAVPRYKTMQGYKAVSYTHLTLPTKRIV